MKNAPLTTADLKPGLQVRLTDFGSTQLSYRRRLLALGITRGVIAQVVRVAPLGCPVQLEIRGTSLALRFEEAQDLQWEQV